MIRTAILVLFAGCSTDLDPPVIVGPDAAPRPENTRTVLLDSFGAPPALIVYRAGNGPWRVPEKASESSYALQITDDYEVVTVCADAAGGFDAQQFGRTRIDDAPSVFCFDDTSDATVEVTGHMAQPGEVTLGASATSTTAPWQFHLDVAPGFHDLVASNNTRLLIRRDLSILDSSELPMVDLVADGEPLQEHPLTLTGADSDDEIGTSTYLLTENGFGRISNTTDSIARTTPRALVQPGDFEMLVASANTGRFSRWSYQGVSDDLTSIALLPRLRDVAFVANADQLTATWGDLTTFDTLDFNVTGVGSRTTSQRVSVSAAWLAATGTTRLGFDTTVPGYDERWRIDLARPYMRSVTVEERGYGAEPTRASAVTEAISTSSVRGSDIERALLRSPRVQRSLAR